ncbi:MAG TPA: response regulator transcription factor [Candidatus Sulfotelmatobacter sp.]
MSTRRGVKLSSTRKIKCVLTHEHILLRQGLRRMLEDQPDIEVAGEAGNAMECLRQIFEYAPEVVIADPKSLGLSAAETDLLIERESPGTKLVFLDTDQRKNPSSVRPSEMDRFATRETSMEELVGMVRELCGNQSDLSEQEEVAGSSEEHPEQRALTAREREVLKLLAQGKTVRAAASDLGLSSKTVDAHKFNLMRKLGIHNKADLVMWAIQKKVVTVPAEL